MTVHRQQGSERHSSLFEVRSKGQRIRDERRLTFTSDIFARESSLMARAPPRCVSALSTFPVASTRLSTYASLSLHRICSHARSTQPTAARADLSRFCKHAPASVRTGRGWSQASA